MIRDDSIIKITQQFDFKNIKFTTTYYYNIKTDSA